MSVENFSGNNEIQTNPREFAGKRALAVGAITLAALMPTGVASADFEAAGGPQNYGETRALLVGGTDDPFANQLPGYEYFTDGVPAQRIHYPASMLTYDNSVREGAQRVYEAIMQTPEDTNLIIVGHSQGGHAAWDGTARAMNEQPERRDNTHLRLFGDPGHPRYGAFTALPWFMSAAGVTPPAPRPDIGVDTEYYCIKGGATNDSVCSVEGGPDKIYTDWLNTHPRDKPHTFVAADPARLVTIRLSPNVTETLLSE